MKSKFRTKWLLAAVLAAAILTGCATAPGSQPEAAGAPSPISSSRESLLDMGDLLPTAASAFVYERTTGSLLYQRQADTAMIPGGFAKLVTAMVAAEDPAGLQTSVEIPRTYTQEFDLGPAMRLRKGEVLSRQALLYGMLLENAGDAAVALAENIAGSQDDFAAKMNDRVKALGCTGTYFSTPHGADMISMTTARDMAILMDAIAGGYPEIMDAMACSGWQLDATEHNTGRFLSSTTNLMMNPDIRPDLVNRHVTACFAGYQQELHSADLVCTAEINGMDVILVIFGAQRSFDEYQEHVTRWGNYEEALAVLDYLEATCRADGGKLAVNAPDQPQPTEAAPPTAPAQIPAEPDSSGEIHVTTADEFLQAIGPMRTIVLDADIDLTQARDYGSFSGGEYYRWEEMPDGFELRIQGASMLTIQGHGVGRTRMVTTPRYANVLFFEGCTGIQVSGFTAGHTEAPGTCAGGVLCFYECAQICVDEMGLFGCGTTGIDASQCQNVSISDCDIYECTESGIGLWSVTNAYILDCSFRDIGNEFDYGATINLWGTNYVTLSDCTFRNNYGEYLLRSSSCVGTQLLSSRADNGRYQSLLFTDGRAATVDGCAFTGNTLSGDFFSGIAPRDRHGNDLTAQQLADMKYEPDVTTDPAPAATEAPKAPEAVAGEIHVSTVDELLAALASDTVIVLDAAEYDLCRAADYGLMLDGCYTWEAGYDGPQLIIQGLQNLTIRSAGGTAGSCTISAIPRYANVLNFRSCKNVTLSGFTAGHTIEPGSCVGGVLNFENCTGMNVENCGLFGCGVLGISARLCQQIQVKNTDIYECSYGGVEYTDVSDSSFECCTFRDLGGSDISLYGCTNITCDGTLLRDGGQNVG